MRLNVVVDGSSGAILLLGIVGLCNLFLQAWFRIRIGGSNWCLLRTVGGI